MKRTFKLIITAIIVALIIALATSCSYSSSGSAMAPSDGGDMSNGADKYEGGGVLEIDNNLGSMDIHVPADWHIIMQVDNSLGATSEPDDIGNGPTLTIRGDNNLGSVSVDRV